MARQGTSGSRRGFASMDKDKQRAIASKGGRAAHEKGTAHEFSSEEARIAGRKGGEAGGSTPRVHQSKQPGSRNGRIGQSATPSQIPVPGRGSNEES